MERGVWWEIIGDRVLVVKVNGTRFIFWEYYTKKSGIQTRSQPCRACFLLLWIKVSSEAKKQPESRLRVSQEHSVRSDFTIVKTQVVFFCEKSPPLAVTRHSWPSGFWLFEGCYRIRKRFLTSEDIRMRTVIVKAKTVCTTYSKSEVTQGYLVALASPPPRTGSRFYPTG